MTSRSDTPVSPGWTPDIQHNLYLHQASCLLVKDGNGGFSLEIIEV